MPKSKLAAWERHQPEPLKRRQLLSLIARLQQALYLDHDGAGRAFLNPEKHCNGAEVCEQISSLLRRYELAPQEPTPWKEIR